MTPSLSDVVAQRTLGPSVRPVIVIPIVLLALALGFGAGRATESGGIEPTTTAQGLVDSVDADGGSLCLRAKGEQVECYHAPGLGIKVGEAVTLRVRREPLDRSDPAMGSIAVVVEVIRK